MSKVDKEELAENGDAFLDLEFNLKIALNNLFLLMSSNLENEEFRKEVTYGMYSIEFNSFLTIKLSLDLSIIPIKKCLMIFHTYMVCLFGISTGSITDDKIIKLTKSLKKELEKHDKLGDKNPVEEFYRRHIIQTKENPIPQILIVGILRILLTTCPTANRTSGGIDLHREWSSSLKLLFKYPKIYETFIKDKKDDCPIVHEPIIELMQKIEKLKIDKSQENLDKDDSNSEEEVPETDKVNHVDEIATYGNRFVEHFNDLLSKCKYENFRHSLATSRYIGLLLVHIQRNFKSNHVIQAVYFSSLIVDANGVLVLLKFINQDFSQVENSKLRLSNIPSMLYGDRSPSVKQKLDEEAKEHDDELIKGGSSKKVQKINKYVIEDSIRPLLQLMYIVCEGQFERIDKNLIQYKAVNIMKRIANNFKDSDIKVIAYKIIMIQVRYMKDKNMKIISQVYDHVELKSIEDWIRQNEDADLADEELNQKEIGEVNKEFNIRYYWQNLEKLQDEYDEAEGEGDDVRFKTQSLAKTMKINHPYYKMFMQCPPLTDHFKNNYQQWLEEEVWGYYD